MNLLTEIKKQQIKQSKSKKFLWSILIFRAKSKSFAILCTAVHAILFFFSYSLFFFLYLFLGILSCLKGMPLNRKRKQRSENKAEKRSFHELPNKENENQGLLDLILILILLFCRNYNDPDQAILLIPRVVFSPFVKKKL